MTEFLNGSSQPWLRGVWCSVWNEEYWLPANITWSDLQSTEDHVYPQAEELGLIIPAAIAMFISRFLFETYVCKPCAAWFELDDCKNRAPSNVILEKVYMDFTKNPSNKHLMSLTRQLQWSKRRIDKWFALRKQQDKPSTAKKFSESMWKFVFYVYMAFLGTCVIIWNPWVFDTRQYWENWPFQAAKMANYCKQQRLCDALFGVFAVVFMVTRLGFLPLVFGRSIYYESWEVIGPFPSWYFINTVVILLLILHIYWSCLIIAMMIKAWHKGKVSKDDRSDVESSEGETEQAKKSH
ncbi:ceramide synthase 6-like isoform X2 [Polyodon spathula]|uniref:ceramide synthase 6-like isoform X2 n=1 Tax=Polyodon spathula TaxID=7913 RepID=UPI001B7DDE11|nr:ceramide synthase 6-like isoform X2 [Polyodon spathula]